MENTTKKYQIKLNPYITIYPVVEDKMYTREEVMIWYKHVKTHTVEEAFEYLYNLKNGS